MTLAHQDSFNCQPAQRVEWQIFISYSRKDDEPFGPKMIRPVTQLYRDIKVAVGREIGDHANVWFDRDMETGTDFSEAILDGVANSLILVPLLSPSYLRDGSGWLFKERQSFISASEKGRGLNVGYKSRILPVALRPVNNVADDYGNSIALPPEIQPLQINRKFFDADERPLPMEGTAYENEVTDLAREINKRLIALRRLSAHTPSQRSSNCVFLASSTAEMTPRLRVLRERLESMNYAVLPKTSEQRTRQMILRDLQRCVLSIHFFGADLEESEDDVQLVASEFDIAKSQREAGSLTQIAWMPRAINVAQLAESPNETVRNLVSQLPQLGENFVKDYFDRLLKYVEHVLVGLSRPTPPQLPADSGLADLLMKKVYCVCSPEDQPTLISLEDKFRSRNWWIEFSPATEDSEQSRMLHEKNMRDCQAFVIYYGNQSRTWVDIQRVTFREANWPTLQNRRAPIFSQWIYLGPQRNPEKESYRRPEQYSIIGNFLPPADDFIHQVVETRRAPS